MKFNIKLYIRKPKNLFAPHMVEAFLGISATCRTSEPKTYNHSRFPMLPPVEDMTEDTLYEYDLFTFTSPKRIV